ncbi:MAG: FkbM family methyltransferase [Gallionellaceae bacterium]|nr:FkbM family methyltransferase [Gallionellaceae bacterium]
MLKMIKDKLKKTPWFFNNYLSIRHFLRYELRDIRDSYFSKDTHLRLTPYGFKFCGSSSVHHQAMMEGTFEPEEVAVFKEIFLDSDVFVDVGSNIGFYACLARSMGLHVVAVEPSSKNQKYLLANLRANNWNDVEVFPAGVAEKSGLATLYGASSTGASLINNWANASKFFQQTIALSTLDILLGDRFSGKRTFVKIDVEGFEYAVMLGSERVLKMQPQPTWVVEVCLNEYHPNGLNPNFADLFSLFWRNGYVVRTADRRSQLIQPEDVARWVSEGRCDSGTINYLFTPK